MSGNPFIPRAYRDESPIKAEESHTSTPTEASLLLLVRWLIVALLFLLPIFFVPGVPASLSFDKVMLATVIGLLCVVFLALSSLRFIQTKTVLPIPLFVFWGVVAIAGISGALSTDIADAFRGSVIESQSVGFLAIMGLLMSIPLVFQKSKKMSLYAALGFGMGSALALLYTFVRLFLEPGALSFKSFFSPTVSPAGSFNDLAILSALLIVVTLSTMLQSSLRAWQQSVGAGVILVSLCVLAVVNFFHLWVFTGLFSLILLVYIFSRERVFTHVEEKKDQVSKGALVATSIVFLVAVVFVVAGEYVGAKVGDATGVTYLEVRPSMSATLDIAQNVYREDVLLGTGPNRFADAWRQYKDQSINETIFWNTSFTAGFGYVPTLMVTLGLLGVIGITAFLLLYVYFGYRMLLRSAVSTGFWYFFGVTTFISALFLWGISFLYVSGPVILLLAALFTGFSFAASGSLLPETVKTVALVSNRRRGFLLMSVVIVFVIGAVAMTYTVSKQYVAQATFTKTQSRATTPEEFQQGVLRAFAYYQDEAFLIASAQSRLIKLQSMFGIKEPTPAEQELFLAQARQAVIETKEAIRLDPTNPLTHAALADVLIVLAAAGFQDASTEAIAALDAARQIDPKNPLYAMAEASLAVRQGDTARAREHIDKALSLKPNYAEALSLLAQLDVNEGKLDDAIARVEQIINLEPTVAARHYQLGVLLAAKEDIEGAILAYETAITLDKNFANARYMLALSYLDVNRRDDALAQLKIIQETNKDNMQLANLISQVETNQYRSTPEPALESIDGTIKPEEQNGTVVSPTEPETSLVSPVNTVPGETQNSQSME